VLPGEIFTADLGAIYQAVFDAPARVRRPHARTRERLDADDYAALTVDLGELPTANVTPFSPSQPKHERVTVLVLEMAAPEPPSELVAIARQLTALGRFLPPNARDRVLAAWARCGIVRDGHRAFATLEQGRQLVEELQAIRREVTHAGMIELTHIGGVGPYALNRSSAPDAPPTGCASPDSKATEGGGNGETC